MSEKPVEVLLITDDEQLRALVEQHRPAGARLRCVAARDAPTGRPAGATQVWIDLDTAPGTVAPSSGRRVYFHSQQRPAAETLQPGLFIRKPCAAAVFEVLWAGVKAEVPAPPEAVPARPGSGLPTWLLDFQVLDLKVLCRKCVRELGPRLGYRDASLYLHDFDHGLLTLAETTHTRAIDLAVPTGASNRLMAAVAQGARTLHTDRVKGASLPPGVALRGDRPYQDQACLVAPLVSEGRVWGVLNFSRRCRTTQTEDDLPLDEIFTFLGRALHHARAYDQVQIEARVDGLTGLYNQRWVMEVLQKEIRRAQRFGAALSVLMVDLDSLKSVNDARGHAAGDCVLQHVASRIGAVLRKFDGAARVGGDEFVVLLPGTNLAGARQVARRLLQSIHQDVAEFAKTPVPITASIGVAEWRAGWEARDLIAAADGAMYRAKREGRNKLFRQPSDGHTEPPATTSGAETSRQSPRSRAKAQTGD